MSSQNFPGTSLSKEVQVFLTVGDIENIFFAMGNCSIPLLSASGNKGHLATFNKLYTQASQSLGLEVDEGKNIVAKKKNVTTVIDNFDISNIAEEVTQAEKDAKREVKK